MNRHSIGTRGHQQASHVSLAYAGVFWFLGRFDAFVVIGLTGANPTEFIFFENFHG